MKSGPDVIRLKGSWQNGAVEMGICICNHAVKEASWVGRNWDWIHNRRPFETLSLRGCIYEVRLPGASRATYKGCASIITICREFTREIGRACSIRDGSISCQCTLAITIGWLAICRPTIIWRAWDLYTASILVAISTAWDGDSGTLFMLSPYCSAQTSRTRKPKMSEQGQL